MTELAWADGAVPSAGDEAEDAGDARTGAASQALGASALALSVAACGGGGSGGATGGSGPGDGTATAPPPVRKPATDDEAARFLLQTGIAASTTDITALRSEGYAPWLDRQMGAGPVSAVAWLAARGFTQVDANRWFDRTEPADHMVWNQLMGSAPAPRTRAALALSEFFVVSTDGVDFRWKSQGMAQYWDILSEQAFGNFRTLLEQVTLNPAMGQWLNTLGNRRADSSGRVPDENYAREVMQLFTIGLQQLNPDGTPKLGSNGQPIETYTNTDVQELAKVFTGYDFDWTGTTRIPDPQNAGQTIDSVDYALRPMTADGTKWRNPRASGYHAPEAKTFLGTSIPAGTSAAESLRIALDTLFNHSNTGPFFARQMIQRLVTSNPAPGYVARVAAVFANNGAGVRGDLKAVFRAIWLDDEALAGANATSNSFGKLREPILRLAQWARTFGATSKSGNWTVHSTADPASRLAQSPLRAPSVFNFFRPGYVPANSNTAANAMVAPELQIVNESTAPAYVNFMQRAIAGSEYVTSDLATPYAEEVAMAHDSTRLVDRLALLLTAGQLSAANRALIKGALDATVVSEASDAATKLRRVQTAVLLVMAAPEYLLQR
ncbi:DUF1800 domain-containing protein [Qipengyuania sediminis]|uniref:DUF1800 domain-containing protein n=1 Tax=Qipengyuania sediminis TaxID=1532023 RepID=UPI001059CC65|nr:DUF1800 family protein [Qipengyuania sediminis]